jgi:hypothetical protein
VVNKFRTPTKFEISSSLLTIFEIVILIMTNTMFLKREQGYIIYLVVILLMKIASGIFVYGIGFVDFFEDCKYSIISALIINISLFFLESVNSIIRNGNIKYWRTFKKSDPLILLAELIIILLIVYLIIPRVEPKSLISWFVILALGETLRAFYNYNIIKRIPLEKQ